VSATLSFPFAGRDVRVVGTKDAPHFVAADVCVVLDIANSRQALTRLDEDEKGVRSVDTLGGPQEMATVTESGIYHLAFSSRKPEAQAFRRWVTGEVLPAIRRRGSYELAERPMEGCRRFYCLDDLCALSLPAYTKHQLQIACVDAYRAKYAEDPPTIQNPTWGQNPRPMVIFPEAAVDLLIPIVRRYSPVAPALLPALTG